MLKYIKSINKNRNLSIIVIVMMSLFYSTVQAKTGEEIFNASCKACHTATDIKGVGPGLGNIDDKRTDEWIAEWVKNSTEMIASGDKDAVAIFEEYNKMPMPPFAQMSDEEIQSIVDFLDVPAGNNAAVTTTTTSDSGNRNIVFWIMLAIASLIAYFLYKKKHSTDFFAKSAEFDEPHAVQNLAMTLFLFLGMFDNFVEISKNQSYIISMLQC